MWGHELLVWLVSQCLRNALVLTENSCLCHEEFSLHRENKETWSPVQTNRNYLQLGKRCRGQTQLLLEVRTECELLFLQTYLGKKTTHVSTIRDCSLNTEQGAVSLELLEQERQTGALTRGKKTLPPDCVGIEDT